MSDIFQGDPALFMDENGSYMTWRGGQPVMDGGWENAIQMSLFTKQNWSGNTLLEPENQIGSDFEKTSNISITITSLNQLQNSASRALQWMIDFKIASDINVRARNPSGNRIEILIYISPPDQDKVIVSVSRIGVNWQIQKIDPAHGRM